MKTVINIHTYTHTHTHTYIYIYIYMSVYSCLSIPLSTSFSFLSLSLALSLFLSFSLFFSLSLSLYIYIYMCVCVGGSMLLIAWCSWITSYLNKLCAFRDSVLNKHPNIITDRKEIVCQRRCKKFVMLSWWLVHKQRGNGFHPYHWWPRKPQSAERKMAVEMFRKDEKWAS